MIAGHETALPSGQEAIARARREITAIKAEILAGNPDLQGLCLGLSDWSQELRRLLEVEQQPRAGEMGLEAEKPAAAVPVGPGGKGI